MALMDIRNWKISGIAAAVPGNVVENSDYSVLSAKEKKLLIKTTGIERKHVAEKKSNNF
jgi:3-oxoacyl-[acyl-carrier-protein] synthase III